MKSLQVVLPDAVFARAEDEAKREGLEVGALCSALLADLLLGARQRHAGLAPAPVVVASIATPRVADQEDVALLAKTFDVAAAFPDYPRESVSLAQAFVDEALKYGNSQAFKTDKGVGIKPNFAFVEYLRLRPGTPGIGVSLYGNRDQFPKVSDLLIKGRTPSYSRARISNAAELKRVLPLIREAYRLRFG